MYRRRSKLEITLGILSVIRGGLDKPLNIVYAVNLNWKPAQRMLSNLVEKGLLEVRENTESKKPKRRYVITDKGINMLEYFEKGKEMLHITA